MHGFQFRSHGRWIIGVVNDDLMPSRNAFGAGECDG